jgi:hypothetical protein
MIWRQESRLESRRAMRALSNEGDSKEGMKCQMMLVQWQCGGGMLHVEEGARNIEAEVSVWEVVIT